MLFLLILSFHSGFDWVELEKTEALEISEVIKESKLVKRYGEQSLEKWIIHLTSDVFGGGCMVVLSKGTQVIRVPDNLKIVNSGIKMKKFDRYVALYEEGDLKREWKKLEKESAEKLGISSLSSEELERFLPGEDYKEGTVEMNTEFDKIADIEFPERTYYSFMEIEKNGTRKLIPVVMEFCPIGEKIGEYMENLDRKGD
jgi:hypothetical protein